MFTNLKGCKHDMNMILTEICCQTNFLIFAMFFVFKARFLKVHVCSKIKNISMFSTKDRVRYLSLLNWVCFVHSGQGMNMAFFRRNFFFYYYPFYYHPSLTKSGVVTPVHRFCLMQIAIIQFWFRSEIRDGKPHILFKTVY